MFDIGLAIPTCKEGLSSPVGFARPDQVIQIIRRAEELGYHSVWGNDHITAPQYAREAFADPPNFYEPLTVLAAAAPVTSTIRLAAAVLVLPLREPVFLAKQIATLDQFCGGRAMAAVGLGAYREEFERLHPRLKGARRGDMLDEGVEILHLLFTQREASFKGRYYEFDGIELAPKPLQHPFPLFIGGNDARAVSRAARWGQGWLPASIGLEGLTRGAEQLRQEAAALGREPSELQVAPQMMAAIARTHEEAVRRFRESWMYQHLQSLAQSTLRHEDVSRLEERNLVGSPEEIIEQIRRMREAGVTMLAAMNFVGAAVEDWLEQMQLFGEEVMPAFGSETT